jgi:hypothetical protein
MGVLFFEYGSWVNKVGPWVQKKDLLKGGWEEKQCDSTSMTVPSLIIGQALVHLKWNQYSHGG